MAQPIQPQNDPDKQVMVEDDNISLDAVTTRVELRESGIAACYLTANNEEGKLYLESLHLNDRVVVKLVPDSAPPTAVNWAIIDPVFDGNIQELSPILNISGQVCQVVAYGKGYQMKEMRVSKQYGFITPVLSWGYVNHFDDSIHEWDSSKGYHRGAVPYINSYSGLGFPLGMAFLYLTHCIFSELSGHFEDEIGVFTLGVSPEYDGGEFVIAQLHIVGALYSNGSGTATSVAIRPYWTIDDGVTWTAFTNFPNITFVMNSNGVNDPIWETYGLIEPYPNTNYNPSINAAPPTGDDVSIDITSAVPYWNENFKIKLKITGIGGTAQGGVSIALMYLEYKFEETSGKTVRELLAGENGTIGIIPNYVNKILGGSTSSGYATLNTDYIIKDDVDDEDLLIPFMKLPYEDALTSIQDIIKYGSALRFLKNNAGYHWKVDTDGNLLVALTTNHDVAGLDGSHIVSSKWVLQPYATPIKVKREMITQDFKESIPLANYVLVAGKFHYPLNDNICRGLDILLWQTAGGTGAFGARNIVLIDADISSNSPCLEFQPQWSLGVNVVNIYAFPLPTGIDLTMLMGFDIVPIISFWLKTGGGTNTYELRLYPADPDDPNKPNLNSFYTIPMTNTGAQDTWAFIEITLPNTQYQKNYDNWSIATDGIFNLLVPTIDWMNMKDVKYWGIKYNANAVVGTPYVRMRGFSINGTVIRGAYDSANIALYGCRMITVKDSMASTDSLSVNDDKSPLALEAIYDLQRYRRVRITGEISIPLDPVWQEGQQVWIQTEEFLPVGASYTSASGHPTVHTVGTVGSYYIDTVDSEVFLCTAITLISPAHYHYTWVDQNVVRYKIDKWFRITKVTHEFTNGAALTKLMITDDLYSSLSIDTTDVYTVLMRANNPDFQTKTLGSLKSNADYDLGLPRIAKDYTAYTY